MKRIFTCITVVAVVFCALFAFCLTAQAASNETLVYSNDFSSSSAGWYQFGTNSGSLSVENGVLKMSNHTEAWHSPAYDIYSLMQSYGAGTYWVQISAKYTGTASDTAGAYMSIRGNGPNSFLSNYSGNYLTSISSHISLQENVWTTFYGSIKILESDFNTVGYSTTMVLCLDGIPYGSDVQLFIDDVKIYRMDDTCITNGSFNSGLVGWRPWCNTGEDEIGAEMLSSYNMFYGRYMRVEKYGSIACNVDQVLSYYGPGTYTLSFRMWDGFLDDNSNGNFDVYFSRGTSDYHYWIGRVNLNGNMDTFTFTVNITEDIYNNFRADLNEVFFRLQYSGDMDAQILYFLDDVSLTPVALQSFSFALYCDGQTITHFNNGGPNYGLLNVVSKSPANAPSFCTYSSSNPEIVSVDSQGRVTAHSGGVATITAVSHNGNKQMSIRVAVNNSITSFQRYSQERSGWCWLACAKMLANHYAQVNQVAFNDASLLTAFSAVKPNADVEKYEERTGTYFDRVEAIQYFLSRNDLSVLHGSSYMAQDELIEHIDNNELVILNMTNYKYGVEQAIGHSCVIYGYYYDKDFLLHILYYNPSPTIQANRDKRYSEMISYSPSSADAWVWTSSEYLLLG